VVAVTASGFNDDQPNSEPDMPAIRLLAAAAALFLTFAPAAATLAQEPIRPAVTGVKAYTASLSGANGGAANATGRALVVVSPGSGTVCYAVSYEGIRTPTAAHIHAGAAGATGPPVVHFSIPRLNACMTDVDRAVIQRIITNPANFYVNVHTEDHPGGAIRGQLAD
jgi:hypothetical protein